MGKRHKRRTRGRRRPSDVPGDRHGRPPLPNGSHGKVVPVEIYPRYSTMVGDRFPQDLFDVSAFRAVTIPTGSPLKIKMVETDDSDLGWDGRPAMRGKSDRPRWSRRPKSRMVTPERREGRRRTEAKRRQAQTRGNRSRRNGDNEE